MQLPISITGILIILVVIYIWYIQFYHAKYPKVFIDELIKNKTLKTGDMILFKADNNFNSIFIMNYFGHMGMIYVDPDDPDQTPMLFESNGIETMPLLEHHNKNGVFFTKFADRAKKYKGRVFVKSLNHPIDDYTNKDFREFIDYCMSNMKYNIHVVQSAIKKFFGLSRCDKGTNCAEIVFLSLIKLGLLDISRYDEKSLGHIKWMSNIRDLDNGMKYSDLVEVIDHPFDS